MFGFCPITGFKCTEMVAKKSETLLSLFLPIGLLYSGLVLEYLVWEALKPMYLSLLGWPFLLY